MRYITITTDKEQMNKIQHLQNLYSQHLLLLISDYNEFRLTKGMFQLKKKQLDREWDNWISSI